MDDIEETKRFLKSINQYNKSIYKWCYAKEINYVRDPRYDDDD